MSLVTGVVVTAALIATTVVVGTRRQESLRSASAPSVTVVSTGAARQLPSAFVGVNGANIASGRDVWTNPALSAAVRSLGPQILRLFGGTTANFWDWRTGNFSASPAVPRPYSRYRSRELTRLPLPYWAALVKKTRVTPLYVLNMVTSTLPEQIAMLRQARSLGMPVGLIELGNELWDNDKSIVSAFPTAQDYGRAASMWIVALKQEFPGVKIAAVGYGGLVASNSRKENWDAGVLEVLRGEDALTIHPYVRAGLGDGEEPATPGQVATMLQQPVARMDAIRSEVLGLLPPGVELWFTEWNLLDRAAAAQSSWAQGLVVARYGILQALEPKVGVSTYHDLIGSGVFGALYGGEDGLRFSDRAAGGAETFKGPSGGGDTSTLQETSAGTALKMLFAALAAAKSVHGVSFDGTDPPRPLAGLLVRADNHMRLLLLNGTDRVVSAALGDVLPTGGTASQVSGPPSLRTSRDRDLNRRSFVVGASATLAPYSLTLISG